MDKPLSDDEKVQTSEARTKANLLIKRVEWSLNNAQKKRTRNQFKATVIILIRLTLSAVATILLGLQIQGFEPAFKNIAFAFGAIVTLLTALEPFFNYHALWIEHELAKARFYHLRDDLDHYLAGKTDEQLNLDVINYFHDSYQTIWDDLSIAWIKERKGARSFVIDKPRPAEQPILELSCISNKKNES
ncbi:MAG: SLATT domain-containing protein [Candidatus Electrothrix sp. YB6]